MAMVPKVKLGEQGLEVSRIGLGCAGMSMSPTLGPPKPESEMLELIRYAVDLGVTFFDTSDFYGPHTSEIILGKALKGDIRKKVQLATKFGVHFKDDNSLAIRGDPQYVRAACEASLKRLDIDCIDLYYAHRVDSKVPIEVTMGELKRLVEEGKIKYVGLSEASASTIRRAHAVHPITALQTEWSLWSRDLEDEIVPTCRELGIGIVPYSPLGRGFLAAGPTFIQNLPDIDLRKRVFPRFMAENLKQNKVVYDNICGMATRKGCTPAQLSLAWVLKQGVDVCPIPGTTKKENLHQNLGAQLVDLIPEEMAELESYASADVVKGNRQRAYVSHNLMNPETPPLSEWNKVE